MSENNARVPFMPDFSQFGSSGKRNTIDVADTTEAIKPFTNGKAALVVAPTGQLSNTNAIDEISGLSPEKRNLLASMLRSY